jgi:hypothetical protein
MQISLLCFFKFLFMSLTRHLQTILVSAPMCLQIPLYLLTNVSQDWALCHGHP